LDCNLNIKTMLSQKEVKVIKKSVKEDYGKWPVLFDALSDFTRFRIFKLLMQYNDLCVTDIANIFNISLPAVSKQLKILEMSGFIKRERMGQMIRYKINVKDKTVKAIIKILK